MIKHIDNSIPTGSWKPGEFVDTGLIAWFQVCQILRKHKVEKQVWHPGINCCHTSKRYPKKLLYISEYIVLPFYWIMGKILHLLFVILGF